MSFQFGAAIGWTIVPLVVAWFVSQFWKARHAPLVAVGVISVTSLSALVTNNKAGDEVRTVYMAELGHELDGWRNDVRAWLGQGVGNWQRLKGRAAIERHVRSGGGLRDAAMLLQKELIGGTRFKERLADRVRSERRVDEAWAVVRELPDILQSRKELALVRQLIDAQLRLCAEVHQLDGHFLLLGSGELVPNADVDQGARDRIRELQPQVLQLLAKVREIPSLR
ncbi:MAG: hypothetical protein R3F29_09695 [Planctomycetota bacterium]